MSTSQYVTYVQFLNIFKFVTSQILVRVMIKNGIQSDLLSYNNECPHKKVWTNTFPSNQSKFHAHLKRGKTRVSFPISVLCFERISSASSRCPSVTSRRCCTRTPSGRASFLRKFVFPTTAAFGRLVSVLEPNEIAAESVMENTFSDGAKPEAKVALTRISNAARSITR